ncbi:MAG: hypothetical protein MHM6MM_009418, partial [Cercozoa sp. M6MM]
WKVSKRYSVLAAFHRQLRKLLPTARAKADLPNFPSRFIATSASKRVDKLNAYFDTLCQQTAVQHSGLLSSFFAPSPSCPSSPAVPSQEVTPPGLPSRPPPRLSTEESHTLPVEETNSSTIAADVSSADVSSADVPSGAPSRVSPSSNLRKKAPKKKLPTLPPMST